MVRSTQPSTDRPRREFRAHRLVAGQGQRRRRLGQAAAVARSRPRNSPYNVPATAASPAPVTSTTRAGMPGRRAAADRRDEHPAPAEPDAHAARPARAAGAPPPGGPIGPSAPSPPPRLQNSANSGRPLASRRPEPAALRHRYRLERQVHAPRGGEVDQPIQRIDRRVAVGDDEIGGRQPRAGPTTGAASAARARPSPPRRE